MLHKLLPILLLAGCLDAPTLPFDTVQPAVVQPVAKTDTRSSVYRSTDRGRTWTPVGEGLPNDLQVSFLAPLGDQLVLASGNYGLYLSDAAKQNWHQLSTHLLPNLQITALLVEYGVIYAGVYVQGIFASYDLGKTWKPLNLDLKDLAVRSILRISDELWVGTDNGIYASQIGSKAWRQIFAGAQVTSLLEAGKNIVAGTHKGIVMSGNNGGSWNWVRTGSISVNPALADGSIIASFVTPYVVDSHEVETSKDNGATWQPSQQRLPALGYVFETVDMNGVLVCCNYTGIFNSSDDSELIWGFIYPKPTGAIVGMVEQGESYMVGCSVGAEQALEGFGGVRRSPA
ncbi:MAG: hypothetical protein HY842_14625 [Bacteroidetes bacterium]|nr:hypothetical protein [Bacteroidota bacterium]